MSMFHKIMFVIRSLVSIGVVALALLQLLDVWDSALELALPLLGINVLLQSIFEWKEHRGSAIFGLCTALFIFICTFVVWFIP